MKKDAVNPSCIAENHEKDHLASMIKRVTLKWTAATRLAYNKTKRQCEICGSSRNRGNWANHLTTNRHKKAFRKLKAALKKKAAAPKAPKVPMAPMEPARPRPQLGAPAKPQLGAPVKRVRRRLKSKRTTVNV